MVAVYTWETALIETVDRQVVKGVLPDDLDRLLVCFERVHEDERHIDPVLRVQILDVSTATHKHRSTEYVAQQYQRASRDKINQLSLCARTRTSGARAVMNWNGKRRMPHTSTTVQHGTRKHIRTPCGGHAPQLGERLGRERSDPTELQSPTLGLHTPS